MRKGLQESSGIKTVRKLWIGIAVLALLSPLGLILPALSGTEGAWGEWGIDEVEKLVGFVPEGMKRLADRWKAPLPEYAVPGQKPGPVSSGLGYILAGFVGIAATAGIMYLLTKFIMRRKGPPR